MAEPAKTVEVGEVEEDTPVKGEKGVDKKALRKQAKEAAAAEKAAKLAAENARQIVIVENGGVSDSDYFGDLALVQSKFKDTRKWWNLEDLTPKAEGEKIWIRARLHTVRGKGKLAFLLLRRGFSSVQGVVSADNEPKEKYKEMVKFASKISSESVVDVFGQVHTVPTPIASASQSQVEIKILKLFVVSLAAALPFQIEDAARSEPKDKQQDTKAPPQETQVAAAAAAAASPTEDATSSAASNTSNAVIRVGQDIRLDNRWIDVRTPANHAIFRIQSRVGQYFRQYFIDRDFIEIHSPKITPGVSEGGAAVFRLKYFGNPACLAQSPQLYKQMSVLSDLFKVFEIGPVFRAEDSNTHRHMCEFVGMDFEMEIKQHYHELLDVLGDCFVYIFDNLNANCKGELAAVNSQYPFEPLKYKPKTLVIDFREAVRLLREDGEKIGDFDDFSTPQEKRLGRIIKAKYDVELYVVDKYPVGARPYYTMPCPEDPRYTNSYDVFLRGEEITSGSQRIHDVELLKKRAAECGIPGESIASYVESFKHGSFPHGGAGIGLERVVMLFMGLDNIRKTSLFPRTPTRCAP